MIEIVLPVYATRIVVYLLPINMRWGAAKLHAFCRETLGIEPDFSTAFLFANKTRDCLLMYSMDDAGDQVVLKKLDRGAFLLPAASKNGKPYVEMKPTMLSRLFRA